MLGGAFRARGGAAGGGVSRAPPRLREESPSAENKGEVDVLGRRWGGDGPRRFPGVTVTGWTQVGNYALSLEFSDGHRSGIYSWELLRSLAKT
ncbi:MAG: gamma-butyrobetaine hydroxylase-like domain-containing protein [Opitutia bacterium]